VRLVPTVQHVLKCHNVRHHEAQEEESHDLAIEVECFGAVLQNVSEGVTHIDAHRHLVGHHLHEFPESRVFIRVYQVVLPIGTTTAAVISIRISTVLPIIDHVGYQADLKQVSVLGHLAEPNSEFLLRGVVEV